MSRGENVALRELNERLTKQPYVAGYTPSSDDEQYFKAIFGNNINTIQWAARMASYYPSERKVMKPKPVEEDQIEYDGDSNYDE